jgi:1,4-alpha-glucan branching enzyme
MPIKKQFLKTRPVVKVTFEVSQEASRGAHQVFLICEANNWERMPLKRLKKGNFKGTFDLPTNVQDDYEYRFCMVMADGREVYDNDWTADSYRPNPVGGDNSVVRVAR